MSPCRLRVGAGIGRGSRARILLRPMAPCTPYWVGVAEMHLLPRCCRAAPRNPRSPKGAPGRERGRGERGDCLSCLYSFL